MRKLLVIALVAAVSAVTVGTASAFPVINKDILNKLYPFKGQPTGQVASPGDAFYANVEVSDGRAECAESGGISDRRFDENGNLIWFCIR